MGLRKLLIMKYQSEAKMNFKKNLITAAVVSAFLSSQLVSTHALAQFDEFPPPPVIIPEDDDVGTGSVNTYVPPPPRSADPSAVSPNSPSTSAGQKTILGSKTGKTNILSPKQKEKFAKATPEDITSENFPETIESFDFPNVDILDIVKAISELTGKNFIIDNAVRGKITILAPSKITVAEAYKAFLSALALNGFTLVPSGGFLKIRNARAAQRDSIDIYSGSYYPNTDQMITKVVHLKHVTAETIKQQLGRLLNSSYGEMEAYPQTNSIIISDYGSSIDRIMKIINQLDVPGFEEQLEVIGIKYAKAKDIADLIDKVVNKGQRPANQTGGFNAGVPRFSSNTGSTAGKTGGAASFLVFPDDRTNSLIIIGNKPGIARVKRLVLQLDFKVRAEDQGGVYVYYVKHGNAEDIGKTLSEVAKDSGTKATPAPSGGFGFAPQGQAAVREGLFGGEVSIKSDKNTNSLVISASKQDFEKVVNILNKLDIPRDQVFVEAIIMEMNITDGLTSGGGLVKYDNSGVKSGFISSQEDVAAVLNPLAGAGTAILPFANGSVTVPRDILNPAAGTLQVPSLLGYINFVKQFGKTNILSTPQVIATDAQTATIEVGDSVVTRAIVTPGANGAPSQSTPEFDKATIKMEIKPFISPTSDSIRMEFSQSVKQLSSVQVPKSFEGTVQPLAERSIKTNVILNSGDTAVIGGLMKDEDTETIRKVPILGDLPILGWFFKSKKSEKRKVNMLVFLSPKIIRTRTDAQNLVIQKTNDRLKFLKENGGKDPYGSKIDQILKREARAPQSTTAPIKK